MGRYSGITLELRGLGNISTLIGTYTDTIISASGTQVLNGVGHGRMTFSARDNTLMSAIDTGQVAYCYVTDEVVGAGSEMDLALFIIEKIVTTTQPGGSIVTVSGPSVLHQLTYETLDDDAIDNGTGGVDTSDITNIMTYAPSGWSLVGNSATTNGTYHLSRGDNVLKMLIEAAKQSGEMFRLDDYSGTPSKEVRWQASEDASGVTLRMPADPTAYEGSTTVGIILSLAEDKDFTPVVTRIRPYGAGMGVGRVNITGIDATDTGGDPAWMTTTFANNLMVNTTLETSLGFNVKQDVDFSHIRPADPEDATQATTAAVALWNTGKNYLESRDSSRVFYRVRCVVPEDLRPGQTVTVVYDEYEGGQAGGSQVISINSAFTIHEVTNSIDPSTGYRVTDLLLGDSLVPRPTGPSVVANSVRTTQDTTRKADAGLGANTVPDSRKINTDNPIKIDAVNSADLTADRTISLGSLTTFGTANDVIGINAAATDVEYKDILAGTGISVTHAAGSITVTNTGTTADITGEPFLVTGLTAGLSNERALTTGNGIDFTDGGANAAFNIFVDLATNSGMTFSTAQLTLGTPSSITSTSTNSVTTTTHSHAVDSTIALTTDLHDAVTLATDVQVLLGLTGQQIFLQNKAANLVFAGPASGAANNPDYRALVYNDLPIGVGLTNSGTNLILGTPTTLTTSTTNSVSGTTHQHAVTTTSTGAISTIVATDSNGRVQVDGLGINTSATTDGAIVMPDNGWIGLGSAAGRIEFDDLNPDEINFIDCRCGLGTSTPTAAMHIDSTGRLYPALHIVGTTSYGSVSFPASSDYRIGSWDGATFDAVLHLENNGGVYINDSGNANMGRGLTINGGASPNEIIAIKGTNVAHGVTSITETDTAGTLRLDSNTEGGIRMQTFTESVRSFRLQAIYTNSNTAKSAAALAPVTMLINKKSGTSSGAPGADDNLFGVSKAGGSGMVFLIDEDGDIHYDGTNNAGAWDEHNDIELLSGLRAAIVPDLKENFGDFLRNAMPVLQKTKVATFNDDGSVWVNMNRLQMLIVDALRQLDTRLKAHGI